MDCRNTLLDVSAIAPWNSASSAKDTVTQWDKETQSKLIEAAKAVSRNEFNLLGSGTYQFDDQIDWHLDFKSGFRWDPSLPYTKVRSFTRPTGADIKVPWELSRCMHFSTLALADLTGKASADHYEDFKLQTTHWIEENPPLQGVNWSCTMDVAIRATNWINALMLFEGRLKDDNDHEFFESLTQSLWIHGLYIRHNLEWQGPKHPTLGNHFLADLIGLLAIGILFRETRKGLKWIDFCTNWISIEMDRQVNEDGTGFEGSTSYHRLVLEMFMWADTITQKLGRPFGSAYKNKLSKMVSFTSAYTKPSGQAAQFGDNDSGRLLWAGLDDGLDHRYLTGCDCAADTIPNRFLLRGDLSIPTPEEELSFDKGGYHFMSNATSWVGLRAGEINHHGCHTHCDQLSFELNIYGIDILVDRGTACYTSNPAKRNHYRSTALHNTLIVNEWEQNDFSNDHNSIFRMNDDTRSVVTDWNSITGKGQANHRGYSRKRPHMVHTREIALKKGHIELTDKITMLMAEDDIEWNFHFSPKLDIQLEPEHVRINTKNGTIRISWDFEADSSLRSIQHSPSYGLEVPATTLNLKVRAGSTDKFKTLIQWDHMR